MIRENLDTGESIDLDSPQFTSEQEAEMNAAIGAYVYGGGLARDNGMQQPQYGGVYPGGYGYNPNQPQLQPYQIAANNVRINSPYTMDLMQQPHQFNNPYFNNPFYQSALQGSLQGLQQQQQQVPDRIPVVSGYGTVGNGIGNGMPYSPATIGESYNPYSYNTPVGNNNQTLSIYVEPIRMNGEYLPSLDQEEKLAGIFQREYDRMIEDEANAELQGFNNPSSYFGMNCSRRSTQFERDLYALKQENLENRRDLDIRLSKLAHSVLNDGMEDEEIEDMYTGYYVDTNLKQNCHYRRSMMANVQPASDDYREAYINADVAVTNKFYQIIGVDPDHCDMKTFFDNIGAYGFYLSMEEERKRRIQTRQYNMNTFEFAAKQKVVKHNMEKYGITNLDDIRNNNFGNIINYRSSLQNPEFVNPAYSMIMSENNNNGGMPNPQSAWNINQNQNVINQNGEVDVDKIKQNLSQFKSLAKATISDDGTININYGPGDISEIIKSYGDDDVEINQYEKEYEEGKKTFMDTIFAPKDLSLMYRPPGGLKNESGGG